MYHTAHHTLYTHRTAHRLPPRWIALLLCVQALDLVTTFAGLQLHASSVFEANPLAHALYAAWGVAGLLAVKVAGTLWCVGILWLIARLDTSIARLCLLAVTLLLAGGVLVTIWSILQN